MSNDTRVEEVVEYTSTLVERHEISPSQALALITSMFHAGLARLARARLVFCETIGSLDADKIKSLGLRNSDIVKHEYITNISHLVYGTAILDTYLSEILRLLYLIHPESMGKQTEFSLSEIIESKSKHDLLNKKIARKVLDESRNTFLSRIKFLTVTFGLGLSIDKTLLTGVKEFSNTRHNIVHDQGVFSLFLNVQGSISIAQKGNFHSPTPISSEFLGDALDAYTVVICSISAAIADKVLKDPVLAAKLRKSPDGVFERLEGLASRLASASRT